MEPIGAIPTGDGWRFEVWAPNATKVDLVIADKRHRMKQADRGYHVVELSDVDASTRYSYSLDGGPSRPDPASRHQPDGVHAPSQIVDPTKWKWTDSNWRGIAVADTVFYELHVGTFTQAGTFEAMIDKLPYLLDLGINTVELMPIAQFPGGRNWGYDGVYPYAAQSTYGGPDGLAKLVDACHASGLAVCLDVVYNHLGPEGCYLRDFGQYFSDVYKTPWGQAINFDDTGSDEVRRFFVGNALWWFEHLHIDALRLDAIHGIMDRSAYPFLAQLADETKALSKRLGRELLLIAESPLNDARVLEPRDRNGFGHDAQWSDDFHHSVHSLLTGETDGYYSDFGTAERLATVMRRGYTYCGQYSKFRQRSFGNSPDSVPPQRFVVCVQNHDQVGNRMAGERFTHLLDHERRKLAAGLMLLSPYPPMLFMGEEYAEDAPFEYFIEHSDPQLVEAVRNGRREEFESFGWTHDVPDPQDPAIFHRSKLNFDLRTEGDHATLFDLYRELLQLRKQPEFKPSRTDMTISLDSNVLTIDRPGSRATFNLSDAATPFSPTADILINSSDSKWGGQGTVEGTLAPWSFILEIRKAH